MPYIHKEDRGAFDEAVDSIKPKDAGELNYVITRFVHNYINDRGVTYQYLNEAVGVLEAAKLEFYRRIVGPYENQKIESNGDIGVLDEKNE